MSSSARGPQRRPDGPYVLHLERVCQLVDRGTAVTLELNPASDAAMTTDGILPRVLIDIHEGGDVSLHRLGSGDRVFLGLTLANYKRRWRCWVGIPSEAQRRAMKWQTYSG